MVNLDYRKTFIFVGISTAILLATLMVLGINSPNRPEVVRLATTTSVENSGLLDHLLGSFEEKSGIRVDYIAVGSGQAIGLGERGDVDLVLSHAPDLEESFIDSGSGLDRVAVMVNDFIILGPVEDPASVGAATSAAEAFEKIEDRLATFVSRGDNSGTHLREQRIWQAVSGAPGREATWYISSGQGMSSSLLMANELDAYILSDRGTYMFQVENLPNLKIVFGGSMMEENPDSLLMNDYSLIAVNPAVHEDVNYMGAVELIEWMTSLPTQLRISQYGAEEYGISLFTPSSERWAAFIQSGSVDRAQVHEQASTDSLELQRDGTSMEIVQIVMRTLQVSGTSLLLACAAGIPLGTAIGMLEFKFKRQLQILIFTGMGLPPVVVGLAAFMILSNQGLLGGFNWLFSINGMVLAQTVLAFPLACGLTIAAVEAVPAELLLQVRALGATPWQERRAVLHEARRGLIAAVVAALGRIISEVGAVMLVGGNIAGQTRVLSTAIVLETRQGSFGIAMALGTILLGIALLSNAFVMWLGGRWPK